MFDATGSRLAAPLLLQPGCSASSVSSYTRALLQAYIIVHNAADIRACLCLLNCCRSYEGATAAALPEALFVNQGGKRGNRKTVVANSMLTSTTGAAPKASRAGSFGATAQPVGSLALSGKLYMPLG
jgi:hypothetical protein